MEPGAACADVEAPFCSAGRLLEKVRLLLGVASSGRLLLKGPCPGLLAEDMAPLQHAARLSLYIRLV